MRQLDPIRALISPATFCFVLISLIAVPAVRLHGRDPVIGLGSSSGAD